MMNDALRAIFIRCFCVILLSSAGCSMEDQKTVSYPAKTFESLTPEEKAAVESFQKMQAQGPAGGQKPEQFIDEQLKQAKEDLAAEKAAGGAKK